MPALRAHADLAGRQVELVVDHDQVRCWNSVAPEDLRHRSAAIVHEARLHEDHTPSLEHTFRGAGELRVTELDAQLAREAVHRPEADIVPVPRVLVAGVADPDDDPPLCGQLILQAAGSFAPVRRTARLRNPVTLIAFE